MTLPKETIATGAPDRCPECGVNIVLEVLSSPAGYYIGAYCNCGPYCRESGYYKKHEQAKKDLDSGLFHRV